MTRIVELCSVTDAAEAHAVRAFLAEGGVRATIVGESVGSGAGIGNIGEPATPRIWVRDDEFERAREMLDHWVGHRVQRARENVPDNGDGTPEAPFDETSCNLTRALVRVGFWTIGGFGIAVLLVGVVLFLCDLLRALWGRNPTANLVESAVGLVVLGPFALLAFLVVKKGLKRWG